MATGDRLNAEAAHAARQGIRPRGRTFGARVRRWRSSQTLGLVRQTKTNPNLEVAAGTGRNMEYYSSKVQLLVGVVTTTASAVVTPCCALCSFPSRCDADGTVPALSLTLLMGVRQVATDCSLEMLAVAKAPSSLPSP